MKSVFVSNRKRVSHRWLIYMLRCRDASLYTGIANDLSQRLRAHRQGLGSRYTRSRLPVELVYVELATSRSAATRRELMIKGMSRRRKEILIG